jgi:hypothetical protein
MEREALKLAQKAMLNSNSISYEMLDAITAIKAALAQDVPETGFGNMAQPAQEQWNAALDEAAARIGEIKGFGQTTQDSFAVFIKGLKK